MRPVGVVVGEPRIGSFLHFADGINNQASRTSWRKLWL